MDDIRVRALQACFASQYSYGSEYEVPPDDIVNKLTRALEAAIWGNGRVSKSQSILWSVLYKGHAFLPRQVTAIKCARLLHVIANKCENLRQTFEEIIDMPHPTEHTTPISNARRAFKSVGWKWKAAFTISVDSPPAPDAAHAPNVIDVDLTAMPWGEAAHHLREALRCKMWRELVKNPRWDLRGLDAGIDYKRTRLLLNSSTLSFLRKGFLRTILAGAVWTPSRMLAGRRLNAEEARCTHCGDAAETSGHRYWKCPHWRGIRVRYKLEDFDETQWPRCLTRCGVVPLSCRIDDKTIKNIQMLMVDIIAATAECPRAQQQFVKASRDDTRQRSNRAYKTLRGQMAGNGAT